MPRWLSVQPKLRLTAAVVALAATVPVGGARAETIPAVPCSGGVAKAGPSWQAFAAPTFLTPTGVDMPTQEVVAYAVGPSKPTLLAVTNGNSIQVSTDGGCTWQESLRLDQIPQTQNVTLSGTFTKIRGLYIAPKTNRIIALAEELDTGATVGRPHVLINDRLGRRTEWRTGDSGLPPIGKPLMIEAHPNDPNVVYLSFANAKAPEGGFSCPPAPLPCPGAEDNGTPGLLWGSTDGGNTWSRRSDPNDLNGASVIRYFSVDDDDPSGRTIWVVSNDQLRVSRNGGGSYSVPDGLRQQNLKFTAVETVGRIKKGAKNPIKVMAFTTTGDMMRLDESKGWVVSKVPFGAVESVAQRPDGDIVVATMPTGAGVTVWRIYGTNFLDLGRDDPDNPQAFKVTFGWQNITPRNVTVAGKVSSASAGSMSTYFLRDRRRILRFLGTSTRLPVSDVPPGLTGVPDPPVGTFTPKNFEWKMPVGQVKDVDYTLTLTPAPTPIDLYLLVDNSGSMQPLIEALKVALADVAQSLVEEHKVQVRIGVGQINVQPDRQELPVDNPETENIDESKPRPVYERLRPIDAVAPDLYRALAKIDGYGGSGDEAQLEALWQSAVGDGYDALGLGPITGYNVPRGWDAGWSQSADTVKVIVHATDEAFSKNIRGGHNDPAVVADALRNLGIRQIGLSQDVPDAHRDLEDMARRTGAVAPPGGTDCDGNGRADIKAGEPLVCGQNYGLDKTLVNLINSLADEQEVSVGVSGGPTLASVSKNGFTINAKAPKPMKFRVRYSCKGVAPGVYTHSLTAGLRDIVVARGTASIQCGNSPLPPERQEIGNVPPQPPPIQPQPVPAPIAPVQPVPQPQTQVQGEPQVNPQAGAAEQKQRQIQVALAENDLGIQDEDSLAMVGLSAEEHAVAPATAVVIAGMAMASACAGAFALRRRSRTQVVRATVR